MNYFPMFMDIKDREILICGGGTHAAEKIEKLKPFHPKLHVISEKIEKDLGSMADILTEKRKLAKEDLLSCPAFVIAAEDTEENRRIAGLCRELHIPVNAVDQPGDCDFIFPSMFVTEHLCVGVSTGGVSPTGAVCLRNRFTEIIPDDIDKILLWIRDFKEELKAAQTPKNNLNAILRIVMNEAVGRGRILTEQELRQLSAGPSSPLFPQKPE